MENKLHIPENSVSQNSEGY